MAHELPDYPFDEFAARLHTLSPTPLEPATLAALHEHYRQLRRWNRGLSLIGPGTGGEALSRHYGESLAALPWLDDDDRALVDVGSGAGFPGFVLAAARPGLRTTLVESRQRKWAFLESVVRHARRRAREHDDAFALSCRCINARVDDSLPGGLPRRIDVVTSRAVVISPEMARLFAESHPGVRFLLWAGRHLPDPPPGFDARELVRLPESERRWLVEIRPR